MTLEELRTRVRRAKQNWAVIQEELGCDEETQLFLSKSYLVLANGVVQVSLEELKTGLRKVLPQHPTLLKHPIPEILSEEDLGRLDFAEDLDVEVRFPVLKIELIQKVKRHPLADSSKTDTRQVSIVVVVGS